MSLLTIIIYKTSSQREPFMQWLMSLDKAIQTIVLIRVGRVTLGKFGDCKLLKDSVGIGELRIASGLGYRVYFGKQGACVIILLGGDKGSQKRDIIKAQRYWLDYREYRNEGI